jgi:hypothetical protein
MILDLVEGIEVKPPKISEITVVRYYEEIVIENEESEGSNLSTTTESNLLSKPRPAE